MQGNGGEAKEAVEISKKADAVFVLGAGIVPILQNF